MNVALLRQQHTKFPHELRICTKSFSKCNWHYRVRGEKHVLLDCLNADLAELRIKHFHLFCTPVSGSSGKKRREKVCRQQDAHCINLGKGDALAQSAVSPSPMEKITSGDLEGGWQPPAPDQGLESNLFFNCEFVTE